AAGHAGTPDAVLLAYYLGNVGALLFVLGFLLPAIVRRPKQTTTSADPETRPGRIIRYSAAYTVAGVSFAALSIAPRVWLGAESSVRVASLGFACLATPPCQGRGAALFSALAPAAVSQRRDGGKAVMPSLRNALVLLAGVAAIAGAVSLTPWLTRALEAIGL